MSKYNQEILNHYGIEKKAKSFYKVIVQDEKSKGIKVSLSGGEDIKMIGADYGMLSKEVHELGSQMRTKFLNSNMLMENAVKAQVPEAKTSQTMSSGPLVYAESGNLRFEMSGIGFHVRGRNAYASDVLNAIEPVAKRFGFRVVKM